MNRRTSLAFGRWSAIGLLTAAACLSGCRDGGKVASSKANLGIATGGNLIGTVDVVTVSPSGGRYEATSDITLPLQFSAIDGDWLISFDRADIGVPDIRFGGGSGLIGDSWSGTLTSWVTLQRQSPGCGGDGGAGGAGGGSGCVITPISAQITFDFALARDGLANVEPIGVTMLGTATLQDGTKMTATVTGTLSAWPTCVPVDCKGRCGIYPNGNCSPSTVLCPNTATCVCQPSCNGTCGASDGCGGHCYGDCPGRLSCLPSNGIYQCRFHN